jgi:hypothetical protein
VFVDPHWETAGSRHHPKGGSVTMDGYPFARTSPPATPTTR